MRNLLLLISLFLISVYSLAGETVVSLETKEIFGNLGYENSGVVLFLKSGDFGEGGGGNRTNKKRFVEMAK